MLRIGAVSYLNTKPLVCGLEEDLTDQFGSEAELSFDLPSRLADRLGNDELDIALIPAIEFFRGPDHGSDHYKVVSDAVIACRGPVWSVRLLSRVPLDQIRSLGLDEGSRTSQALVQVLLWNQFRIRPRLIPFPIDKDSTSVDADAVLMIGDRAMHPPVDTFVEIWDLGDRWCRWSEHPFVFAVWAAKQTLDSNVLASILEKARDRGVQQFESIANQEAGRLGLSKDECLTYFAENLHFQMGPREQAGLELFRSHAATLGLLKESTPFMGPFDQTDVQ